MRDDRTGIYGAFAARVPVGRTLASVAAVVLLFPCLVVTKWMLGPVGWTEKGVYARAAWDGFAHHFRRPNGTGRLYLIAVETEHRGVLYSDESLAAGRQGKWIWIRTDPEQMKRVLDIEVYGGKLARRTVAVWLGWPLLVILCMIVGQQIDMARLRRARHSGVWLRGNRMVGPREWNSRAGETR